MAVDVDVSLRGRARWGVLCVVDMRQFDVITHDLGSRESSVVTRQIDVEW